MANGCDPQVGGAACWDKSGAPFTVTPAHYISAPTSVLLSSATNDVARFACNYPPTQHLPEGKISTWYRGSNHWCRPSFHFRSPIAPPGTLWPSSHALYSSPGSPNWTLTLRERLDGAIIRDQVKDIAPRALNEWVCWRATWYISFGSLVVESALWNGAAWVNECANFNMPDPLHEGEDWARCGIDLHIQGGHTLYVDDTIITSLE